MSSLTICSQIYRQLARKILIPTTSTSIANYATKKIPDDEIIQDDEGVDLKTLLIEDTENDAERVARIEKLRNKSRLLSQHRNRVLDKQPYEEPQSWVHLTLSYKRKMYGRFGEASGIDPRLLFETPDEKLDREEYERVAHPYTLPEMIAIHKQQVNDKETKIRAREEQIAKNLSKLDKWKVDLENRLAKKEADARAAKDRRERMIEDIRRQFGIRLDPRGEKFKALIEQKELEAAKARKKMKKTRRQELLLEKLKQDTAKTAEEELKKQQAESNAKKVIKADDGADEGTSSDSDSETKAGNDSDSDDEKDKKKKKGK